MNVARQTAGEDARGHTRQVYPRTLTLEKESTTRLGVGFPNAVAGLKTVKINMLSILVRSFCAFSGAEITRYDSTRPFASTRVSSTMDSSFGIPSSTSRGAIRSSAGVNNIVGTSVVP